MNCEVSGALRIQPLPLSHVSCFIIGTVSQCYHDGRKQDVRAGQYVFPLLLTALILTVFHRGPDPLTELNKIRKSLTSLENFIRYSNGLLSPELIEDSSPELVAEATNLATALLGSASRLNGSPLQDVSMFFLYIYIYCSHPEMV